MNSKIIKKPVEWMKDTNLYKFNCPNCSGTVVVNSSDVNCQIFRHGITKNLYNIQYNDKSIQNGLLRSNFILLGDLKLGSEIITVSDQQYAKIVGIKYGKPLDPHESKEVCDKLANSKLIWGCGKPFKLIRKNNGEIDYAVNCDYI